MHFSAKCRKLKKLLHERSLLLKAGAVVVAEFMILSAQQDLFYAMFNVCYLKVYFIKFNKYLDYMQNIKCIWYIARGKNILDSII